MDDIEPSGDEHLRALAALEAVVANNDAALAALAGGAGERPLPALLAAYGKHTLHRILLAAVGITPPPPTAKWTGARLELNAEPQARPTFLLADARTITPPWPATTRLPPSTSASRSWGRSTRSPTLTTPTP